MTDDLMTAEAKQINVDELAERKAASKAAELQEDKVAAEKAKDLLDEHEVRDDPKLLYQLWLACQEDILESLRDCPQSRAQYSFRQGYWLTPLGMLSMLLEDIDQHTCDY